MTTLDNSESLEAALKGPPDGGLGLSDSSPPDSAITTGGGPRPRLPSVALNADHKGDVGGGTDRPAGAMSEASRMSRSVIRALVVSAPLLVSDLLALTLCGLLGLAAIRLVGATRVGEIGWAMPLALLPMVLAYWHADLYPGIGIHPVVELRQLTKLNTAAFLAVFFACLITRSPFQWRIFFGTAWFASLGLIPLLRSLVRPGCAGQAWWGYPVLVISSGNATNRLVQMLMRTSYSGLRPCAIVDPTAHRDGAIEGIPYLNHASAINALIRKNGIRHGVIALPDLPQPRVMEILDRYRAQIPYLLVLSTSSDMPSLWGTSRDCGGLSGMSVHNGLMLAGPRMVKRILDLVLTSAALLAGLPLLILMAILIRLSSRGPIFYGHKRLGLASHPFRAWKFRTMHRDGDAILRKLLDVSPAARTEWERDFKLRHDPRITFIGRFLRKSSLDELPQLWNVLKGEMSLVGPRPIVDGEIEKYGRVFKLYSSVRPGITGLWQVSGRNETTYEQRVQLDNYYVRNWSPWLDVYILARTMKTLLLREGAY